MNTQTDKLSDHNTKETNKIINQLAREWADYVGGLSQARKVVREAFWAGYETAVNDSITP